MILCRTLPISLPNRIICRILSASLPYRILSTSLNNIILIRSCQDREQNPENYRILHEPTESWWDFLTGRCYVISKLYCTDALHLYHFPITWIHITLKLSLSWPSNEVNTLIKGLKVKQCIGHSGLNLNFS